MSILIQDVSKRFGSFQAVSEVNLGIKSGSLVALLGPSGSGKSTLLRLIAGLEAPDSGRITIADRDVTQQSVRSRGIGFVFQHYALFKHMTVRQNIAFSLELRKVPKVRLRHRVEELLDLVQLNGFGDRYPSQLSGGQRQRVALARTLAVDPEVLLLDEPFGALDAKVRKELRASLRQLHERVNVTTVFVTHDQEEAMELADQIVVFNKGRVEQVGTAAEIYDQPATPFVMSFVGPVNVLPSNAGIFRSSNLEPPTSDVFLRPHDVAIQTLPEENAAPAKINRIVHLGWEVQVELRFKDGQEVTAYLTRDRLNQLQLKPQQRVYVKPQHAKTFPAYSLT
ncbi:sulfate/molybdate ABC transporter ATP-binding protein [Coleofasciculus sp. FACHB-1120]|uniref:sulfate/molybdate ABC transporter ATP-binding protein n=1 Tax=Coleofasciculus sp. FACHB-1120 TaxID=2692783 RepID=UPI001689DB67|nr:sulfate/molybdate ABC transporter ATP-binding protein [Coleofasciculus sp. FACHB-1120]MBD2742173.1 sulfate/molybdate ABC transporter ATP-binding protein [Coleofasciculus sp. FACHB-1120]